MDPLSGLERAGHAETPREDALERGQDGEDGHRASCGGGFTIPPRHGCRYPRSMGLACAWGAGESRVPRVRHPSPRSGQGPRLYRSVPATDGTRMFRAVDHHSRPSPAYRASLWEFRGSATASTAISANITTRKNSAVRADPPMLKPIATRGGPSAVAPLRTASRVARPRTAGGGDGRIRVWWKLAWGPTWALSGCASPGHPPAHPPERSTTCAERNVTPRQEAYLQLQALQRLSACTHGGTFNALPRTPVPTRRKPHLEFIHAPVHDICDCRPGLHGR